MLGNSTLCSWGIRPRPPLSFMNLRILRALCLVAVALSAPAALGQELIENVVVRNRLYSVGGRSEVGVGLGLTVLSRLTEHNNLTLSYAYNASETLGFELRAGWALGTFSDPMNHHTGLARQIAEHFAAKKSITTVTDLSDLWAMQGNGVVGVRWAPIYGKLSLMAEVPVHFQAYAWLGAGAAQMTRTSLVYCVDGTESSCNGYLTENKVSPVGSAAVGARFFINPKHSLRLEFRDYSWPDSYREAINRADARNGVETGTFAQSPGFTNLVLFDVGYYFTF